MSVSQHSGPPTETNEFSASDHQKMHILN